MKYLNKIFKLATRFELKLAQKNPSKIIEEDAPSLFSDIISFVRSKNAHEVDVHFDPASPSFVIEAKINDVSSIEFVKKFGVSLKTFLQGKIMTEVWDSFRI